MVPARKIFAILLICVPLWVGCTPRENAPASAPPDPSVSPAPITTTVSPTPFPSATALPSTGTPSPETTATAIPTAVPYYAYSIDYLTGRAYGDGQLEIVETLAENSWFTRYLFRYTSDGLWIYGFLNVPVAEGPAGPGPYPVIIALHGYIDPAIYATLDYTTEYADGLARAGYIVFHPNLRNYPPSDEGDNLFRVGMAIDVLNLIGLVQTQWGQFPLLAQAAPEQLGMWGHSMGGGIITRVITVTDKVLAAVLYAPMSGDERQNFEGINGWSDGLRGNEELAVPLEALDIISPAYFFDRITTPISLHHGRADELVPLTWSLQTCAALQALYKPVECTYYDDMPHTFYGEGNDTFVANVILFFNRVLKGEG